MRSTYSGRAKPMNDDEYYGYTESCPFCGEFDGCKDK
jgi:hypothetical protein